MGSKGRFSNIEKSERFIRNLDSVCQEPKFLEIWMADLGERSGSLQSGRRPVLIVSNDKNNRYSSVLNVIPMTTKMNKRNLPCHVEIYDYEKFGLNAPSTIMVEQLTVVDKKDLMFRVGKINDDRILMEICDAMAVQFPVLIR
jgi:mRNA interferase MazF